MEASLFGRGSCDFFRHWQNSIIIQSDYAHFAILGMVADPGLMNDGDRRTDFEGQPDAKPDARG